MHTRWWWCSASQAKYAEVWPSRSNRLAMPSCTCVVRVHDRVLVVGESTESGFTLDEPHHSPAAAVVLDHEDAGH